MAKTNWQDPKSSEIRSTHISGLQEAVGKLEESIGLETVAGTDIPLTEVFISNDDRCRIYQAPEGKRNWLLSPAPVIKKNGVVITDDFEIDYGGGAVIFTTPISESDILTADATYTKKVEGKGLSTNDFTTAEKNKLAGIEEGAQKNKVYSVNGKTGEVVIDVGDIAGLVGTRLGLGRNASAAGINSVALGYNASAAGNSSVALCYNASTTGAYSVALGYDASAGHASVALGESTSAAGNSSVALGRYASTENANEGILGDTGSYATSKWIVPGSFTVRGTKNFEIPHPKPEKKATHIIRHGAVESPTPGDTLYRWKVQATKDNDIITIDLPDYFIWLNKDVQIFVTPQGHFGNGYGTLNRETEQLEIHCQLAGKYNVLVIGTRNDDHPSVQEWYIKGVEREIGESWTGETYVFSVDEIIEIEEIKEVV